MKNKETKSKKSLQPRLRFPEFVGYGDWEEKTLGEVGEIVTGKTPSTADESLWNGDIQFVTPTDIKEEKYQWKTQRSIVGNVGTKILPKHSTMFTCIASIGKMSLSIRPCITNQQINSIIPNGNYKNEFVYYSLLNIAPLIKATQSNTALPIINKTDFSKVTLLTPLTTVEQQKIADCLSSLDELIEAEDQKLEALQRHKKGLMQELFPSEDQTLPKRRFPEFQSAPEWEFLPIGTKVDFLSGYPFDGVDISEDKQGIRLLRGINVTEGRIRHNHDIDRYYLGGVEKLEKYKVQMNDLVIPMDGSKVGKNSALVNIEDSGALLVQRVARLRTESEALIKFIYQHINSTIFHTYVDKINTSSGIPHISAKQIYNFEICFPSPEEEERIADFLTSIDNLITSQTKKLESLRLHKKGLMQQLFPNASEAENHNINTNNQNQ